VDAGVLEAVIRNRYDVLAHYAMSLKQAMGEELQRLRKSAPLEAERLDSLKCERSERAGGFLARCLYRSPVMTGCEP
jgi:hypothetical protein